MPVNVVVAAAPVALSQYALAAPLCHPAVARGRAAQRELLAARLLPQAAPPPRLHLLLRVTTSPTGRVRCQYKV